MEFSGQKGKRKSHPHKNPAVRQLPGQNQGMLEAPAEKFYYQGTQSEK